MPKLASFTTRLTIEITGNGELVCPVQSEIEAIALEIGFNADRIFFDAMPINLEIGLVFWRPWNVWRFVLLVD